LAQDDGPLISIITVNFNGKRFLYNLFNSILNLNYQLEKIQIIMVDNNSTDGSVEFIKKEFPRVEIIALNENKGYAGGNNEGFYRSKGKYIALVNNDCVVDKDWLSEMLSVFRHNADRCKVGAVGSKVIFYYPYLPLQLIAGSSDKEGQRESRRSTRLGVQIYDVRVGASGIKGSEKDILNKSIKYMDSFYSQESDNKGRIRHWSRGNAVLAVPIGDLKKDLDLSFEVSSFITPNSLQLVIGEEIIADMKVTRKAKRVKMKIPRRLFTYKKDVINSCGIEINRSFYSRDRGFESFDEGQYGRIEEVFGLSGSSFIMDRKMFEDMGCFDDSFFTYYEDVDLFWRSRLAGWKNFFAPKSIVRHFHCGTSQEWSYNFIYHVVRNRLLMIFKCGWPLLFFKSYVVFIISNIINILSYLTAMLRGIRQRRIDILIRIRIFFELFYLLPKNLFNRIKTRKDIKISDRIIKNWVRDF
jgi:GT2 family glycosyltransferase